MILCYNMYIKYNCRVISMDLYKGKNWNVIFGAWCQDHPGYCIIGNDKESLSELTPEA